MARSSSLSRGFAKGLAPCLEVNAEEARERRDGLARAAGLGDGATRHVTNAKARPAAEPGHVPGPHEARASRAGLDLAPPQVDEARPGAVDLVAVGDEASVGALDAVLEEGEPPRRADAGALDRLHLE